MRLSLDDATRQQEAILSPSPLAPPFPANGIIPIVRSPTSISDDIQSNSRVRQRSKIAYSHDCRDDSYKTHATQLVDIAVGLCNRGADLTCVDSGQNTVWTNAALVGNTLLMKELLAMANKRIHGSTDTTVVQAPLCLEETNATLENGRCTYGMKNTRIRTKDSENLHRDTIRDSPFHNALIYSSQQGNNHSVLNFLLPWSAHLLTSAPQIVIVIDELVNLGWELDVSKILVVLVQYHLQALHRLVVSRKQQLFCNQQNQAIHAVKDFVQWDYYMNITKI